MKSGLPATLSQLPSVNMNERKSYRSPAKQKRNLRRMIGHLIKLLNAFPKPNLSSTKPRPQLSRTVNLQTSFPEVCTVCGKHQCEVNSKHVLVQSVGEAFENAFDKALKDFKEKTEKQVSKYSTDLEQELSKILKLP